MKFNEKMYLESGGVKCPYCGSEDITAGEYRADGSLIWQDVLCNDCGSEWTDEYRLQGVYPK